MMKKLLTTLTLLSLSAGSYAALSPEVNNHLKQAEEAAKALRNDMNTLLDQYHNAPRHSEERTQLWKDLKELDRKVEAVEDHLDTTEDKVRSCNSCR